MLCFVLIRCYWKERGREFHSLVNINLIIFCYRPNRKVVTMFEFYQTLLDERFNAEAKIAFCDHFDYFNSFIKYNLHSYKFLKENLYTHLTGFITSRNHFLHALLDETLNDLITGGIIQNSFESFDYETVLSLKHYHLFDEHEVSKILTFEDLSYGFTLWICACLVCFVVVCASV